MTKTLGDYIADAANGFACGARDEAGVIQLRMNNVTVRGSIDLRTFLRVPCAPREIEFYRLCQGDVLFNNTNSTELVGKTALFEGHPEPVLFSNHFTRLRVNPEMAEPAFLSLYLCHLWHAKVFEKMCHRWIGQSAIKYSQLSKLPVNFPNLDAQRRMAVQLKKQMHEVAAARETIEASADAVELLPAAYLREAIGGLS